MPIDYSRYPKNWPEISVQIRERAGDCCEWCGARNGAIGYRDKGGEFHEVTIYELCDALKLDSIKMTRIVLTVARLGVPKADGSPGDKHDKMDVREENLAALCQRCHLSYDRDDHMRHAAETRRRRRIEAGQMELELEL